MELVIAGGGTVRCLYSEELDLSALGRLRITRGSHVEPNASGLWLADLSPASGPVLGPFQRRREALDAERRWLEQHWLTRVG